MTEIKTLTEPQFCKRVGICRMTALRLWRAGILPYCQIGRKIVYLERHIEEFYRAVEQNRLDSSPSGNAVAPAVKRSRQVGKRRRWPHKGASERTEETPARRLGRRRPNSG